MNALLLILTASASAPLLASATYSANSPLATKAAPWWAALRDEAYYRQCQSSCTEFSKGTTTKVELCDDTEVCRGRKKSLDDYATEKCTGWRDDGALSPAVALLGEGRRFKHQPNKGSWISCAVFCATDRNQWYSPRRELGREAFFPDGVWCHRDGHVDYFCQKNLCLPEGYAISQAVRIAESIAADDDGSDDAYFVEEIVLEP